MRSYYLIRLDDACSQMDKQKWQYIEDILDKYGIRPMVGIIPQNEDPMTCIETADTFFSTKALNWQKKGWTIALHGYNHVCTTTDGGINPIHKRSEFAGLDYEFQYLKLKKGYVDLLSMGIVPLCFFAPSHTFDINTIKALREATPIKIISDTIALYPYQFEGVTFIPQQMGYFRRILLPGYWTFCFHPNNMSEKDFIEFSLFLKENRKRFISFEQVRIKTRSKSLLECLLSKLYFVLRRKI